MSPKHGCAAEIVLDVPGNGHVRALSTHISEHLMVLAPPPPLPLPLPPPPRVREGSRLSSSYSGVLADTRFLCVLRKEASVHSNQALKSIRQHGWTNKACCAQIM
jgi:hypothetical protein